MRIDVKRAKLASAVAIVAGTLSHQRALQAQTVWQGATADYNTPSDWAGGAVPGPGTNAAIDNGGTVLIQAGDPTWSVNDLRAGDTATGSGTYIMTGSTATASGWLRLGDDTAGSSGTFQMQGGTLNVNTGEFNVGEQGTGYFNQSGGTVNVGSEMVQIGAASGAVGVMNLSGGLFNCSSAQVWVGQTGTGTLQISNGGTLTVGSWIAVGRSGGTGTLNISGGVLNETAAGNSAHFDIGAGGGAAPVRGTVNQTGGTVNSLSDSVWVGEIGPGTYNLSGGTLNAMGVEIDAGGTTGVFNLNAGGLLSTSQVFQGSTTGSGTINFNGGTLQAYNASNASSFMTGLTAAKVLAGGAVIDSNGHAITIAQPLLTGTAAGTPDGGLTVLNSGGGAGSLTLSGADTFTGPTNINSGTLILGNPLALAGSTLNYNAQGGTLSFGTQTAVVLGGLSGIQNLDLDNVTPAPVSLTVGNNSQASTYSGNLTGNGGLTKVGTGVLTLTGSSTYAGPTAINAGVILVGNSTTAIPAASTLTLNGTGTLGISSDSVATTYATVFNGGGYTLENYTSNLTAPTTGTFTLGTNTGSASTFSQPISGSVNLNYIGPGTLVLASPTTTTGNVNVSAGTLNFPGSLGTGNIYLGGGATLQYAANSLTPADLTSPNRTFTLGAGGGVIDTNGNNVTFAGPIGGPASGTLTATSVGSFTKAGLGTITDSGKITSTQFFVRGGTLLFTGTGSGATANSYTSIGQLPGDFGTLTLDNGAVFNNGTNDFNVADVGGTATSAVNTGVLNINTTTATGTSLTAGNFYVGKGGVGDTYATGTVNQTGGTVTSTSLVVGEFGTGTYNLSGGTVKVGTAQDSTVGGAPSVVAGATSSTTGVGLLNVNGSASITFGGNFQPGAYGTGTVVQTGGTVTVNGYLSIGRYAGGLGTYNISGGTLNDPTVGLIVGEAGTGTLLVGGTAVVNDAHTLTLGNPDGLTSTSTVIQSGGTVSATAVSLGGNATNATPVTAQYQLTGGTLITSGFTQAYPSNTYGTVNLSGGTIQATANSGGYFANVSNVLIGTGGVTFNTASYNVTIANQIVSGVNGANDGGITKTGTGALELTSGNGYTGTTTVNAGSVIGLTNFAIGSNTLILSGGTFVAGGTTGVSINGFGSFNTTHGSGSFTPTITSGGSQLNLTTQSTGEANAGFTAAAIPLLLTGNGFTASFSYNHTTGGPYAAADGIAFVVQDDPRGSSAIGSGGGSIGYAGTGDITKSGAIQFETYNANGGTGYTGFGTNGAINEPNSVSFLQENSPINVNVVYNANASTVVETLSDNVGDSTSFTSTGVNFSTLLNSSTGGIVPAYIGFTGATGGVASVQSVSNFSFSSTEVSAGSYGNNVVLTAGVTSAINVPAAPGASSASVGGLNVGTGATLNVSAAGYYANSAFNLTTGSVAVTGSATFNAFDNGTGAGVLILGPVSDGGTPAVITVGGTGTVALSAQATSLSAGTLLNVSSGSTLAVDAPGATGSAVVNDAGTVSFGQGVGTAGVALGTSANNLVLNGNTINFTGPFAVTGVISDGTSPGYVNVSSGLVVFGGANTYTGDTNVSSGAQLNVSGGSHAGIGGSLYDSGTVKFSAGTTGAITVQSFNNIAVGPGALLSFETAANHSGRTLVTANTLSIDPAGSFNLSNNDADFNGSSTSLAQVTQYVANGYNLTGGGNWQGSGGIRSSTAAADMSHLTALGVVQNNQGGTPLFYPASGSNPASLFDGIAPGPSDILVKYTYFGDANLDGKVDGSDYSLIDAGYASNGTLTGWYYGDFNYDGVIDGSDYALIDNAFNNQGSQLTTPSALVATETAQVAAAVPTAAVPEPASLGLLAVAVGGLLARRRRV